MQTPERIAGEIVGDLHFSSNRMVEGRLVGEQYFASKAIVEAITYERARYEDAIAHCEKVFGKNKSRMWVLKMLREQINAKF